ncbi:hypothetical protein [Vallitalea guaymasensis]|uniref:hypothetical protein n=1 Tax=Vallitalea guaymasensis TaxID=1185412 RepID=UPI000DE42C9F|nr:hypothetical protein [Vallitalea guaymasensis]
MQPNKRLKKIIVYMLIFIILVVKPYYVYGGAGGSTNKANIVKIDNIQYFQFKVSATASTAKYKYKTIGWKIRVKPRGEKQEYIGEYEFSFSNVSQELVSIALEEMFDSINLPQEYREVGGDIHVDAVQTILINGVTDGSRHTDEPSNILNGLPNGLKWSAATQKDLKSYYNIEEVYDPVSEIVPMTLDLEVTSKVDDHTIDMSKGEGSAQVRIYASGKINPQDEQEWAKNYKNISNIIVEVEGQEKILYPDKDFTSLDYSTNFTFNYLPSDIEDGDSDMNDIMNVRYDGEARVTYKLQYSGKANNHTNQDIEKKAPVPDGDPLAILSVPDQVLVGEEILADGSGSIAPKGATIINYKWQVENEDKPSEDGNSSIRLTYNDPKTITISLTVEDSNGKKDTTMKDVKVIKKASPPLNWSPDVALSGPTIVMQGDAFTLNVNANDKEDGPLTPTLFKPTSLMLTESVHNGDNTAKFSQSGNFDITAKATDSGGKSDSASIRIEVVPPKPLAIIDEDGDYKVGQTVILDSSKSKSVSKTYPIDWKLTKWEITPLGSLKEEDIFFKKLNDKEIAFTSKKNGKIEISLTVTNTLGYSNTRTIERTIVGDRPPTANFTLIKKVYRDKDNDKKATLRAFDTSKSPDGDSITKRAWFCAFNSDNNDNDGQFNNEDWYYYNGTKWLLTNTSYNKLFEFADTVDTGNLTDVTVETKHVGKYKFMLKVYEEHDNRLVEFIDTSYILTDDTKSKPGTECITEVDNIAPVTAVKVDVSNDDVCDIIVATDYKDMDLIQLETQLNLLKAEAFANNKELKIHMVTDQIKIGQQHKVKNYYRYARMINLRYYLESGNYQSSTAGGNQNIDYNHDLRTVDIEYETTQGYSQPTIQFEKGDRVDWNRTRFSKSYHNDEYGTGYDKSGVEFQFYNPDNKIATLSTHRVTTNGSEQGMGFCQIWNNITVADETVNITNNWSQRPYPQKHDFYYDVNGLDFSKTKDISFTQDSKKIFLYFTKGTGYDYENENGYNYSSTSITKDFMDYLIYNSFETYVIAQNEQILDVKFNNNNHSTDINNQYASLRELAHCSPVRGKYIIGDCTNEIWKDQLMDSVKKNVIMPNKVTVENNVVTYEFDEEFKEGEELDLTLLQQELRVSDLVGNKLELPKITYKVKCEDNGIKQLSSLCFTNPTLQTQSKEDIEIIKVTDEVTIYKDNEQIKISITDEEKAKNKFGENISEIRGFDFTNVKDIRTLNNLIVILYNNGSVKAYGNYRRNHYSRYEINESKWTNISRLFSNNQMIIGLKNNGSLILLGVYREYYNDRYYDNEETNSDYHYYDGLELQSSVVMLYKNNEGDVRYSNYGNSTVRIYPEQIKELFRTDKFELFGNVSSNQIIIKINGNYYRSGDYNYTNKIEELKDINIKKLIPINSDDFIVVRQDNTLYFSESLRNKFESNSYYPGMLSKINSLGEFESISFIDSNAWIKGTNGEVFIGGSSRINGNKTINARYIPIDGIKRIIPGNGYDEMIIVLKNGERCYLSNYVHSMFVPSSAKYYFVDDKGVSYMNDNGYFYSSTLPYYAQPGWTTYNYRNFTRKFDKVVNCGLDIGMIGVLDGRASVYRKDNDDYYRLDYVQYYSDIVDIIPNGSQQPTVIKKDTNIFSNKNITKYITGNYNNGKYVGIFGLDAEGNLCYNTEDGLRIIETNVEDVFTLEGEIICLKIDGTLSKYGENKYYEKYEGMFVTPKFITLKLKDRDEKICISKSGVNFGYIGGFREKVRLNQFLNSTQIHLGKHQTDGLTYKYKIFTEKKDSIEEILLNQEIDDSWIEVKDLDIISVQDGYYIGVVEVSSENKAIRYSYMKAIAKNL